MTDYEKPRLMLDIDGVLNVIPDSRTDAGLDLKRVNLMGYPIHLRDDARAMVARLKEAYEVTFFSLWNEHSAPQMGPLVGLEDAYFEQTSWEDGYDYAHSQGLRGDEITRILYAKTPFFADLVRFGGRPAAWIDDMFSPWDSIYLQDNGLLEDHDFRLLKTEEWEGLTWDIVNDAVTWADTLASR